MAAVVISLGAACAFHGPLPLSPSTLPSPWQHSSRSLSVTPLSQTPSAFSLACHGRRLAKVSLRMAGAFGSDEEREDERGNSLPLFYRSDNGTRDSEFRGIQSRDEGPINPYVEMLESISPGEMVGQFMTTASPRVQTAVKNTIMGLLGSLRASPAFDTSIVTTQRAMASLMFQLEMTGYMFRNAEYRLSLQKSLLEALPPAMEEAIE
eukprot:753572-Hanusia_phi.AAC.8